MIQSAYTDWLLCLAWVKKKSAVLKGVTLSGADADDNAKKFRIGGMLYEKFAYNAKMSFSQRQP